MTVSKYQLPALLLRSTDSGDLPVINTVEVAKEHNVSCGDDILESICDTISDATGETVFQGLVDATCKQTGFGPLLAALKDCASLL
jgi:hypothetical protein